MIGQTIGHYAILEKLGEGGMGVVYKARDTRLDRMVALKFLPRRGGAGQPDRSRFLQEAKSASALNHPNICTIHYLEEVGDEQFIVMEYVEGSTLRDRIPAAKVDEALDIVIQAGDALHEAHARGIVHRDIKAENIMVNARNQVKVMDFGLAKIKGSLKLTRSSSTVGTLAYMAPEQMRGQEADPRSDIFSLGVVLFELLTGATPFRGEHEAAVMYSVLNEEPEPLGKFLPDAPPALSALIERALEKDPADRHQHADDFVSELRRIRKQTTKVHRPAAGGGGTTGMPGARGTSGVSGAQPEAASSARVSRESGRLPDPAGEGVGQGGVGSGSSASSGAAASSKGPGRMMIGAAVGLAAVIAVAGYFLLRGMGDGGSGGRKMIVVLPFENLGSPDQEYFADGITEEITGRLSGISGLGVIAASSARQYKKTSKSLKEVAGELGVGYVLQGTIRWGDGAADRGRVRVTPALIRVDDGTQVWSQSFNAVVSDVFSIQSNIASQVAGAMGVSLLNPEKESLGKRPTENSEAYDFYLRGMEYLRRSYRREDFEIAVEMYSKAVDRDPNFALAWALLSESHAATYWFHHDHTPARVALAKEAVDRALAIDPTLPEAHMSLGYYYYWCRLDYENALSEFFLALKSRPNDGRLLLAIGAVQRRQGKVREAVASFTRAVELDPRRAEHHFNLAQTYGLLRDFRNELDGLDRAIGLSPDIIEYHTSRARAALVGFPTTGPAREALRKASSLKDFHQSPAMTVWRANVELFDRRYPEALRIASEMSDDLNEQFFFVTRLLVLGQIRLAMGDREAARKSFDSAVVEIRERIRLDSTDGRYFSALGIALAGLGRKAEAIAAATRGTELMPMEKEAWRGAARLQQLAQVYAMTGEKEKAVELLADLIERPSFVSTRLLQGDPAWEGLKGHPGFEKILAAQ